jgi:nucleoside-diphosphate-sugar epimerase
VYGNGSQSRCFAHVPDVVHDVVLMLEEEPTGGRFNIGGTAEPSIVKLARKVIERTGSRSRVRLVSYQEAYGDGLAELGRRKPDTTALRELTGPVAARTVDDAIDDLAAYERGAHSAWPEARDFRIAR